MALALIGSKRDFRSLLRVSEKFLVLQWFFYRDNILRNPPLVNLKSWLNIAVQIIGGLDLRIAGRTLLLELILELFSEYRFTGLWSQFCPNLFHLYQKIRAKRYPLLSHLSRYRESLENRISALINHCGEIFDCNYGVDLVKLLKTDFALELDGLAQDMKEFIIVLLSARIFMHRLSEGERTQQLKTCLMIDDAQQIFRRVYELQESPFFMADLISQAREWGTGLVVCAQNVRELAFCLTGNTSHKILLGFGDGRDMEEFGRIV